MAEKKDESPWYAPTGRSGWSGGIVSPEATAQRKSVTATSAASTAAKASGGTGAAKAATAKPSASKAANVNAKATEEHAAVRTMSTGKPFTAVKTPGRGTYDFKSAVASPPKGPGPRGPGPTKKKGPATSAVAVQKRTVTKPAAAKRGMSDRMDSAGYTTSAPSKAWSGYTFGSKSSAGPKVAAAKKTKTGASHNPTRKSLFNPKAR